jgi:hypothetical protein
MLAFLRGRSTVWNIVVADFGRLASMYWDDVEAARCVECCKFIDFGWDSPFGEVSRKFDPLIAVGAIYLQYDGRCIVGKLGQLSIDSSVTAIKQLSSLGAFFITA